MARLRLLAPLLAAASLISAHEGADYKFSGNDVVNQIVENSVPAPNLPGGWYASERCVSGYCVYANPGASGGAGIAALTTASSLEKLKVQELQLGLADTTAIPNPRPYEVKDVPGKGKILVATETIRRGTKLLSSSPSLIVHRNFFNETFPEKQDPLLELAVSLLPAATQSRIYEQMNPAEGVVTLKDVLERLPFEANLGVVWVGKDGFDEEKHLLNYPDVAPLSHNCRPNAAFHIDNNFVHQVSAVRKIQPGEEISISYFNPFLPTAERQEMIKRWLGKPCSCSACTQGGRLDQILVSDGRLEEIQAIESKLRDFDTRVTTGMLTRLVQLYQDEGLESRLANMYGQVAINYNSLGYQKRCVKYANLAVQAGLIEHGTGSNDVIAMRILAKESMEHYSWRARLKNKA
ncbi:uncharacterized protein DNG_04125 [Cephalotrichum gorgonifer]|uniref:SET domain-containing protein n=1 Tax=Cephalotrichum gorgonifer TaxID=2041049 RepID=A0AAE8SU85_9PEZI|nr:uncharacterized protein DNG_04125 [Cephalotrichum gorgonifer]